MSELNSTTCVVDASIIEAISEWKQIQLEMRASTILLPPYDMVKEPDLKTGPKNKERHITRINSIAQRNALVTRSLEDSTRAEERVMDLFEKRPGTYLNIAICYKIIEERGLFSSYFQWQSSYNFNEFNMIVTYRSEGLFINSASNLTAEMDFSGNPVTGNLALPKGSCIPLEYNDAEAYSKTGYVRWVPKVGDYPQPFAPNLDFIDEVKFHPILEQAPTYAKSIHPPQRKCIPKVIQVHLIDTIETWTRQNKR